MDKDEERNESRYKQTSADPYRRSRHRRLHPRSIIFLWESGILRSLYGGLVILSFLLPHRKGPLITATICSVVDLTDRLLKPTLDGVPLWMGVTNRLFSLTAIWLPLLFFLHRRRAEDTLQRAHDELETRVQARTHELATVNQALVTEIAERMETEQSLRASEAVLQE